MFYVRRSVSQGVTQMRFSMLAVRVTRDEKKRLRRAVRAASQAAGRRLTISEYVRSVLMLDPAAA